MPRVSFSCWRCSVCEDGCCWSGQCVRVDGQVSWIKLPRHEMEQRAAGTRGGNKNICRMEPRHETGASHVTPSQVTPSHRHKSRYSDHLRTPRICVRLRAAKIANKCVLGFSFLSSEPEDVI